MNKQKNKNTKQSPLEVILKGLFTGIAKFFKVCFSGLRGINFKRPSLYIGLLCWLTFTGLCVVYNYAHLQALDSVMKFLSFKTSFYSLSNLGLYFNYALAFLSVPTFCLFYKGLFGALKAIKYQRAIDSLGIKNAKGIAPRVISVISLGADRKILQIKSSGMGPNEWEKRKDNLSFEIQEEIEEIKASKNKKYVEIYTSTNDLPNMVSFDKEMLN